MRFSQEFGVYVKVAAIGLYFVLLSFVFVPFLVNIVTTKAPDSTTITYEDAAPYFPPVRQAPTYAPIPPPTPPVASNAPLIKSLQQMFYESVKHVFEGVEAVVLMDNPDYSNRGDSALYTGEVAFIRSLNIPIVYECPTWGCDTEWVKQVIQPQTGLVCFSGGGNFGDLYSYFREAKEKWLQALPEYRVLQFPQTVHFKHLPTAKYSATIWGAHPNVTITVRDEASADFLAKYYPTNKVLLVPDAAYLMGPQQRFDPEVDILWLMRVDKESTHDSSNYTMLTENIMGLLPETHKNVSMVVRDWGKDTPNMTLPTIGEQYLTRRAYYRTIDAFRILSTGKIVVSDRLHAHILSTILDIPHVVLDNENGKVFHVHQAWTSAAVHIKVAKNLTDAMEKAIELLQEYNTEN